MKTTGSNRVRGTITRSLALGATAGILVTVTLSAWPGSHPPSATADTALAVTATAAQQDPDVADSPFPNLAVTVSQTTGLISQGVTVSWTGAKASTPPSGNTGGQNFLQIAQCWGEDPKNPGHPDRTTCQYGAFNTPGARRDGYVSDGSVAPEDEPYTAPRTGIFSPPYTSIPFRSVDGTTIASVVNGKQTKTNVNVNAYFNPNSSNEVPWAGSASNGAGSVKFEIQTALQANGLGCGAPTGSSSASPPQTCWLVLIPRGTADAGEQHITQSGLRFDQWKHNIAFKLTFKPLGVTCALGAAERQLRGSELVGAAVSSWQPVLCNAQGGAIYTMSNSADSDALAAANGTSSAPLALTSRALGDGETDALRYAPIAVGGLAIAFAVDRSPTADSSTPADQLAKAGLSVDSMKLTPRLVAKLLTASYVDALPTYAAKKEIGYDSLASPGHNARNLLLDPDFQKVNADNPDWKYQAVVAPSVADLLIPQGRSDAALQLWRYVLSDPDAAAFLAGTPDPWGMKVNTYSSTSAKVNATGTALTLPRDDFPKADPVVQPAGNAGGEVNLVTWRPYTNDFDQSAYYTLRGDGQTLGLWDPTAAPPKYGKSVRNLPGYQKVLALTDTSSAAKYQVATAQLLNSAGAFVAPTSASLAAAAAAMTPVSGQPQVAEYDPSGAAAKAAKSAYPLALPVYAASNPGQGDTTSRTDYAAFIRFAATTGQQPGVDPGQLPAGYSPIPAAWKAQALAAADAIQSGPAAATPAADTSGGAPPSTDPGNTAPLPTAAGAPAAAPPAAQSTSPAATGKAVTSLTAGRTVKDPDIGALPAVVPGGIVGGLVAAAAAPLIGRIRRFR